MTTPTTTRELPGLPVVRRQPTQRNQGAPTDMTRYALPAILGGQELDGEAHGDGIILDVPGYGNLLMPAHYVIEVKPPLPPIPDVPAVLVGDLVWVRGDIEDEGPVFFLPGGPPLNWEELHAAAQGKPIIPLVPADDASELPWKGFDEEDDSIHVEKLPTYVKVAIRYDGATRWVGLKPAVAREAASALLRAAREVQP